MHSASGTQANIIDEFHIRLEEFTKYAESIRGQLTSNLDVRPNSLPSSPSIWYSTFHVHCGGNKVSMAEKPLLFKLFKIFIDSPGHSLSRDQLLAQIYPVMKNPDVSKRLKDTHAHNLVKLLGRARQIAEKNLCGDANCRWFVHDLRTGNWALREIKFGARLEWLH